jgi:hypothetical protein
MQIIYINIMKRSRDQTPHVHLRRIRLKSATPSVVSTTCCLRIWWSCRRKITAHKTSLFVCYQHYSPALSFTLVLPRLLSFLLPFLSTPPSVFSFLSYSSSFTLLLISSLLLHIFLTYYPSSYISLVPLDTLLFCSLFFYSYLYYLLPSYLTNSHFVLLLLSSSS